MVIVSEQEGSKEVDCWERQICEYLNVRLFELLTVCFIFFYKLFWIEYSTSVDERIRKEIFFYDVTHMYGILPKTKFIRYTYAFYINLIVNVLYRSKLFRLCVNLLQRIFRSRKPIFMLSVHLDRINGHWRFERQLFRAGKFAWESECKWT